MMYNAVILNDLSQDDDLVQLVNELEKAGITTMVTTKGSLDQTLKEIKGTGATLFYSSPKIRIDMPVECCSWLNSHKEYKSITVGKHIACFIPDESFVLGGSLTVRKAFHDESIRVQEKTKWYLVYTGERVVPEAPAAKSNMGEHLKVYAMMYRHVVNKNVLDIACGCGYGTYEISKMANSVVGADVSEEAVEYAASHYVSPNLKFTVAHASEMSLGQFDVVTSVETFEHVNDVEGFINKAYSSLVSGGVFCFSTPNGDKLPYDPKGAIVGFHIKHYKKMELEHLLSCFQETDIEERENIYLVVCKKS
jgi:2-polyprenyl-3-methyl-5-hydroxy-6-metoxy-1,4-benzoquinol methylase